MRSHSSKSRLGPRRRQPFRRRSPGGHVARRRVQRRSPSAASCPWQRPVADVVLATSAAARRASILTDGPHFGGSLGDLREQPRDRPADPAQGLSPSILQLYEARPRAPTPSLIVATLEREEWSTSTRRRAASTSTARRGARQESWRPRRDRVRRTASQPGPVGLLRDVSRTFELLADFPPAR